MNQDATSLDRVHDVIAPTPTAWWPPAPGWQALLVFLLVALLVIAITAFVRWQKRRYRREAIAELELHEQALAQPDKRANAIAGITRILKRAAVTAWPRPEVASLTGPEWLDFLDRTADTDHFRSPTGALFEAITYDPRKATGLDDSTLGDMTRMVRHWLLHHRTMKDERRSS